MAPAVFNTDVAGLAGQAGSIPVRLRHLLPATSPMTEPTRPPSVDAVARRLASAGHDLPHPLLVDAARQAIAAGDHSAADQVATAVARDLLQRVVNATGVLLHTNLGRAPLGPGDPATVGSYTNLELDLGTGERGTRGAGISRLVERLTGAEAALVVNNGAAAVLLTMAALAGGRDIVVSRGELVEIGGGFRIPEIVATSGARLVEVGTTNRTRLADHARAVDDPHNDVGALLVVHRSNFRISGFTEQADLADLARLGPPVVSDIGSGLLDARTPWLSGGPPPWLAGEPAVRQTLEAGAALVTFSGDKLLGGPQAGIVAGRRDLVEACARHPLARALRPGRLVATTLQDVLMAHLRRDTDAIPFWRMATISVDQLRSRAAAIVADVSGAGPTNGTGAVEVVDSIAVPGGGTLPGVELASAGVAVEGDHAAALRQCRPPVIARVELGRTILDLRTVDPSDDYRVTEALRTLARP